jgi:hypothetical protein
MRDRNKIKDKQSYFPNVFLDGLISSIFDRLVLMTNMNSVLTLSINVAQNDLESVKFDYSFLKLAEI